MELWRISIYSDLSGVGGLFAEGRWHSRGQRIVYLADHPSTALLETLVHIKPDMLTASFRLLRVSVPENCSVEPIGAEILPADWRDRYAFTRQIGDRWLDQAASALLQVPSVIVPRALNYLMNPAHPEAGKITVRETVEAPFDSRLFR